MVAYIKRRKDFKTVFSDETIDYTLPIANVETSTGSIKMRYDGVNHNDDWLYIDGYLFLISGFNPDNQDIALSSMVSYTLNEPYTAFDREFIWPEDTDDTEYFFGPFIKDILEDEYINCSDYEFAFPYIRVTNGDNTPMEKPKLEDTNLYSFKDLVDYAREHGIGINYSVNNNTLRIIINPPKNITHNIHFHDGHNQLSSTSFTNETYSKVTVMNVKSKNVTSEPSLSTTDITEVCDYFVSIKSEYTNKIIATDNFGFIRFEQSNSSSHPTGKDAGLLIYIPEDFRPLEKVTVPCVIVGSSYAVGTVVADTDGCVYLESISSSANGSLIFELWYNIKKRKKNIINERIDFSGHKQYIADETAFYKYGSIIFFRYKSADVSHSIGDVLFELPYGYRPLKDTFIQAVANGKKAIIGIKTTGVCNVEGIEASADGNLIFEGWYSTAYGMLIASSDTDDEDDETQTKEKTFYTPFSYYLNSDGTITDTPPSERVAGKWTYVESEVNEDPKDRAQEAFDENVNSHKIEFYSDKKYDLYDNVKLKLSAGVQDSKIVKIEKKSTDTRILYTCGLLPTTLTEQIKKDKQDDKDPVYQNSESTDLSINIAYEMYWDEVNDVDEDRMDIEKYGNMVFVRYVGKNLQTHKSGKTNGVLFEIPESYKPSYSTLMYGFINMNEIVSIKFSQNGLVYMENVSDENAEGRLIFEGWYLSKDPNEDTSTELVYDNTRSSFSVTDNSQYKKEETTNVSLADATTKRTVYSDSGMTNPIGYVYDGNKTLSASVS